MRPVLIASYLVSILILKVIFFSALIANFAPIRSLVYKGPLDSGSLTPAFSSQTSSGIGILIFGSVGLMMLFISFLGIVDQVIYLYLIVFKKKLFKKKNFALFSWLGLVVPYALFYLLS